MKAWRRLIWLFDSTLVASSELKIHCLGTVIRKPQRSQFDQAAPKEHTKDSKRQGMCESFD
jgi:hypothetical protein